MSPLKRSVIGLLIVAALLILACSRTLFQQARLASIYSQSRSEAHHAEYKLQNEAEQRGLLHNFECFRPDKTDANVLERLCRANASVVVADLDNNGQYYVFFNTMKEGKANTLYKFVSGKFIDVTKGSGLELDLNTEAPTTGAIFFDYDNDGKKDLFVLKAGCHKLYKNLGEGHFKDVSKASGISKICSNGTAVNALDYDQDGYLDLYIGGFFKGQSLKNLTHPIMPDGSYQSQNSPKGILLHNESGHFFADTTQQMGLTKNYHTWAIAIFDINHDGYPDFLLANDHGPSATYLNEQGKHFRDISIESGIQENGRYGMCVDTSELENDGRYEAFVSDISLSLISSTGNSLWRFTPKEKARNMAVAAGAQHCGWAWGCKFADLNRDGIQDLFVTSGYWNLGNKKQYIYSLLTIGTSPTFMQSNQYLHPPTSKFAHTPDDQSCVFQRSEEGDFTDVSNDVGANQAVLGKGVAVWDFENSGAPGILIATSEGNPILYRNVPSNTNHWVGFKLKAKHGNADAWGARLRLYGKNTSQFRELYPANGFKSQSDDRLFFGLGAHLDQNLKLDIRWPTGYRQTVEHFEIDKYNLIRE